MITFYLLLIIPIVWALIVKFVLHQTIGWLEMFSTMVISALMITVVYWSGVYGETRDTLIVNGAVTSKAMQRVSCRHSYSCRCRPVCSGSGKSRSCYTHCDTCYEHSFDQDWDVFTTIGTWSINTIDRQGLKEPPRWTLVAANDPVSKTETYTNYVKAVPESLFNFNASLLQEFKNVPIPEYPITIYDYYKADRFIAHGVPVPDIAQWNYDISYILGQLGPSKQVNAIVIVTNQKSSMFAKAMQSRWIGGKKNDVVIIIGAPEYPKISWVSVFGWSKHDLFNVQLRDNILAIGEVDRTKIVPTMRVDIQKSFQRKEMKEFEYLKDQIEPPAWVIWLAIVLSLVALAGATWYFHKIDLVAEIFGSNRFGVNRR